MKTSRCFEPAPTAPFRGLATNLAWCRSCHDGPNSATSSAITSADKPVILRSPMIAARASVHLPLFLWGPLLAAVTISYHRRHRTPRRPAGIAV